MPEFTDIYVLSKSRDIAEVAAFLDTFATVREETADEYEIPQYSQNPTHVFRSAEHLIDHCCRYTDEPHAIYWHTSSGEATYAMVFFLSDGHVIYGLSIDSENQAKINHLRQSMVEHTGSPGALITWERPPPNSALEFKRKLSNSA